MMIFEDQIPVAHPAMKMTTSSSLLQLQSTFGLAFECAKGTTFVLGLVGAWLLGLSSAHGVSGDLFFGTIGSRIAVGAVLGAFTLPFYNPPKNHWISIARRKFLAPAYGMLGSALSLGWVKREAGVRLVPSVQLFAKFKIHRSAGSLAIHSAIHRAIHLKDSKSFHSDDDRALSSIGNSSYASILPTLIRKAWVL